MAGFAVMSASGITPQALEIDFQHFLGLTAGYKQLNFPANTVYGRDCVAAKLDAPASKHPGIIQDDQSGSWLLAAGTLVELNGESKPADLLHNVLQNYLEHGIKALESVDGSFALVIYNGREKSLSVISDSYGLFGIFYGQQGQQVFISSSAFAVARQMRSMPDVLAVEHFLRAGRLDGDKTLWQGVKRLQGGSVLHWLDGQLEEKAYWRPVYDETVSRMPMEEALGHAEDLFLHTFSRLLKNEGKTWVDLTGGFDSRLVSLFVSKLNLPFMTYCMGPEQTEDVRYSEKISQEMNWEYVHTQLPEEWGPDQFDTFISALGCGDGRANLLRFAVTRRGFAQRNATIKTNVMGIGGENWRGLTWQIEKSAIGKSNNVNSAALLNNLFPRRFPIQIMRQDRNMEVRQEMAELFQKLWGPYAGNLNSVKIDRFEMGRDSGHGGAYLSAVTDMERSLAPLCFKEIVNFAFSLNYRWKLPRYHVFVRSLIARENPHLASLETTTGGPAHPIQITNIPRFWPLWRDMSNRAVAIGSKTFFGKSVQLWPRTHAAGYPLPAWQKTFHSFARSEGLLSFDSMYSAGLYKKNELNAFIEEDPADAAHLNEYIDRVISIEMAMRAVGSTIE